MSNQQQQDGKANQVVQDALQDYLANPQNATNFVEDFDYDNFDVEALPYDPAAFEADYLALFGDGRGLKDAFDSIVVPTAVAAANLEAPAPDRAVEGNVLPLSVGEQPQPDLVVGSHQPDGHLQQHVVPQPQPEHITPTEENSWTPNIPTPLAATAADTPLPGLQFANHAQAQQAFAQREVPSNWHSPHPDTSIPQTQADREKYITDMLSAIADTRTCQDSSTVESYQGRWAGLAQGRSPYTSQQMETVCWKLLDIAEKLHAQGPGSLRIFDQAKLRTVYKSRKLNFAQRIQFLCDLMQLSKSRCETLLAFDDLEMTVGAPAQMISMAKTNKKQNLKRQEYLVKGRARLCGQGKDKVDGQHNQEHEAERNHVSVRDSRTHFMTQPAPAGRQGPTYPRVATYQDAANSRVPDHKANVHLFSPFVGAYGEYGFGYGHRAGIQPALKRYPTQYAVEHAAAELQPFYLAAPPAGKRKRDYDELGEDGLQQQPNKRAAR